MWNYGCQTYAKESVARVDLIYRYLPKDSTPMPVTDCHLELDTIYLLGIGGHCKFQMLLGIIQCMVTIGRLEL